MSKFKQNDFWFSSAGDLAVDATGDIKDTRGSYARAVLQEIRDRLRGAQGDWKLTPQLGANMMEFLGASGHRKNIQRIVSKVIEAVAFDGLLDQSEVEVLPLPINDGVILFRIILVTKEGEFSSTLGFDTNENRFIGY